MINLCDYINILQWLLRIIVLFINNLFFVIFLDVSRHLLLFGSRWKKLHIILQIQNLIENLILLYFPVLLDLTLRLNLNIHWRLLLGIWRSHFNSCLKFILACSVVSSPLTNNEMWLVWLPTPCLPLLCFSCVSFLCFCIYISSLFIIWCPGLWRS